MREKEKEKKRKKKGKTKHPNRPNPPTLLTRVAQNRPAHLNPASPLTPSPPPRAADRWGPPVRASFYLPPAARSPAPPAAATVRRPLASPRLLPSLQVRRALNRRRPSRPRPFLSPETAAHRAARHQWRPPPYPPSTASPAAPPLPSPPI
jgi:hypothetical protein